MKEDFIFTFKTSHDLDEMRTKVGAMSSFKWQIGDSHYTGRHLDGKRNDGTSIRIENNEGLFEFYLSFLPEVASSTDTEAEYRQIKHEFLTLVSVYDVKDLN